MSVDAMHAVHALNQAFLRLHSVRAQQAVNELPLEDLLELLQTEAAADMITMWNGLMLDMAARVLQQLPEAK